MSARHHTVQIHIGRPVDDVFVAVADPNGFDATHQSDAVRQAPTF